SSGNVVDSTTARDVKVAGVANNAQTSGGAVAVIISGNTQVTADGAVSIGDQLVLDGTGGHVSSNNNAVSGIVGIAMSSQASGTGLVSVFVRPVNGQSTPIFQPQSDTATAFQVQNAANSKSVFDVDTSAGQIVLGTGGASGVTGQAKFNYSGQTGSITLAPANPSSSTYTITLPAE